MDPVTHLTSGLLGSQAARRWFPEARFLIPYCLLAAWIPDVDILFGNGDPEFKLLHHRGITTSFFGGLVMALIMAGLYKLISRKTPYVKATLLAYSLILTHVWLDLITTYGTQILSPFSNHRFALDGAFIIDPLYTGIMLITVCLAFVMKKWRHRFAFFGMAWIFIYPLGNMAAGAALQQSYAARLDAAGIPYSDVHVTPDALSPRYWKVVTTSGKDYLLDTIDLFGYTPLAFKRYTRAADGKLETLGKQDSMFSTYAWFAKWPIMTERHDDNGTVYVFGDLRFHSTNPVMQRVFKDRKPFTLTARVDADGHLADWEFVRGASSIEDLDR